MMERAASSTLPHPSGFGASALQGGGNRLSSSSCSGSPISGAGSALLMQMLQQQSSPALGFSQHASSQLPESPEDVEDQEHLATMELFRRLSHSETSPAPLSKMSRTLSTPLHGGGIPGVPSAAGGGGLQGHSPPPSLSLGHAHSATGIPAPLGRFRPSLSTASSHPSPLPQHHSGTAAGLTQPGSETRTQGSGEFDLPSSITLTPTTDAMQAAGLINLALSQPGSSSFLLQIQPQHGGKQGGNKGNRSLLATAISVVLATRKINAATQQSSEVAMLPTFSGAPGSPPPNSQGAVPQEAMEVHVYRLHVPSHLSLIQAQTMRVDNSSSPLVLALQLAQAVQNGAVVDVLFSTNTAGVALQAMALARTNIASSGQDMVLLPQQTDSSSGSSNAQLNALRYKARAIPTALLLQSREPNSSSNSTLPSPMPNALDFAALGMGGGMRTSPSPPPSNTADPSSSLMTSAALMDRLYGSQYPPSGGGMNNTGSSSGSQSQAPHTTSSSSAAAAQASNPSTYGAGAYGGGLGSWGGGGLPDASAFPPQHNPAMTLLGNGGPGALPPLSPAAAAANARPRARKADWVIVTEDTAIKNAAGAVAKVLGRVSDQGLCCPVFTEKKTDRYTAVVSVAVKAITVARGYVSNEGMGHELGFQPYLRGEGGSSTHGPGSGGSSRGGVEGSGEKGGGGKTAGEHRERKSGELGAEEHGEHGGQERPQAQEGGGEQKQRQQQQQQQQQGQGKQQLGKQGKQRRQQQQQQQQQGQQQQGQQKLEQQSTNRGEGASSGDAHPGGSSEGNGGSGYGEEEEEEGAGGGSDTEKAEMAFDVYKLPQMPELPEVGNLPVKVTAHSRPNVVSNIITKLVSERDGAILITAGGKAMHVAMTAVVSARARLRARCCDVLLLPRFVTVDTTSTLGWESVFLRFTIVRWPMLPPASAASMAAANAGLMGGMGPLGMAAGGVGAMGGGMSNPWAPLGGMALPGLNPMMAASMASAGLAGAGGMGGMGLGAMGGMGMNGGMGAAGLPGFEAGAGPFADPTQAAAAPPPAFLLPPPHQAPFMPPFMPHGAGVGRGTW